MVKLELEIGSKATAEALFEGFGCEALTGARAPFPQLQSGRIGHEAR
jgi:hypothetical protein